MSSLKTSSALQRILKRGIPEPTVPEPVKKLFSEKTLDKVFAGQGQKKAVFIQLASMAIAKAIPPGFGDLILGLNQLDIDSSKADWINEHLQNVEIMSEDLEHGWEQGRLLPKNITEKILNRIIDDLKFLTQDPYKNFEDFIPTPYIFTGIHGKLPDPSNKNKTKMDLTRIFILQTLVEHRKKNWDEARSIATWIQRSYGSSRSGKDLNEELDNMFIIRRDIPYIPLELRSKEDWDNIFTLIQL